MKYLSDTKKEKINGTWRCWASYQCEGCLEISERRKDGEYQFRDNECIKCSTSKRMKTHGQSRTRLHNIWNGMKQRCGNKNNSHYHRYGGRGITVCKEWLKFETFQKWSMENGYNENLTIDRKNGKDIYKPSNCRWADYSTQNINKDISQRNTSGFANISFSKAKEKWEVKMNRNKVFHYIGAFDELEEAVIARNNFLVERDKQ